MRSFKLLFVVILVGLFSYSYGIITVKNRIFPFYQLKALGQALNFSNHDKSFKDKNQIKKKKKYKIDAYYYHRKSFFERHGQKDYDLVFVGDSLTEAAEWEDLFPTMKIANRGIKGDTTEGVLTRLDSIYSTNALKAFIMIGLNDFTSGKKVFKVFENYKKIVSSITAYNIPVCIQSTILAGKGMKEINNKIIDLNKRLKNLADQNQMITYIDLNKELSPHSFLEPKYSIDQIHLNGEGYDVWKRIIASSIIDKR